MVAEPRRDPRTAATQIEPVLSTELPPDYETEVETFLDGWVAAWTEQRPEAYLACYAEAFVPEDMERGRWEEQRWERISRPGFIRVRLTGLGVLPTAGGEPGVPTVRATFVQAYRSDTYSDAVLKTLDLSRGIDGWRIVRETSEVIEI